MVKTVGCWCLIGSFVYCFWGCSVQTCEPQWTYYLEPPYVELPDAQSVDIYYSEDLIDEMRTSKLGDSSFLPPHATIAIVTDCGMTYDIVLKKAHELGASGVILSMVGTSEYYYKLGIVETGKVIMGATFIKYKEENRPKRKDSWLLQ